MLVNSNKSDLLLIVHNLGNRHIPYHVWGINTLIVLLLYGCSHGIKYCHEK